MSIAWSAGLVLAATFISGAGIAHEGPNLLLPEDDFLVKWHQPHSTPPVQDWEIEVTPLDGSRRFWVDARVMQDDSCWAVQVPYDQPAYVRVRAIGGGGASNWSQVTSVPEPGFGVAGGAGAAALCALARRRRARDRPLPAIR